MSQIAQILIDALGNNLTPFEQSDLLTGFTDLERASRDPVIYNITKNLGTLQLGQQDGITVFSSTGARSIRLEPDGDAFFGSNIDDPAKTSLSIFSNDQYYNAESLGSGDLLLGDNSPGKANLFWDSSEGRLNFRSGTTTFVYIDTDGGIVAEYGKIGGWDIDDTRIYSGTDIELDSSVPEIRVDTNKVILNTSGITAVAGAIAGWTITSTEIKKTGIILDSANDQIIVGAGSTGVIVDGGAESIRSKDWVRTESGWIIEGDGYAEFYNVNIRGKLRATTLEKGQVIAVGGNVYLSKGSGTLLDDVYFSGPAVQVTVQGDEEGNKTWANNDIIYMAGFNLTTATFDAGYYKIVDISDNGDGTYEVYLDDPVTTSYDRYYAGQAFAVIGQVGDGTLELEAGEYTGITIRYNDGTTYPSPKIYSRFGDMYGMYGAGSNHRWGFGVGDYSSGNYLSYNAEAADTFILSAGGGVVLLNDDGIEVESPASASDSQSYKFVTGATANAGVYNWMNATECEIILDTKQVRSIGRAIVQGQGTTTGDVRLYTKYSTNLRYLIMLNNASQNYLESNYDVNYFSGDLRLASGVSVGRTTYDPSLGEVNIWHPSSTTSLVLDRVAGQYGWTELRTSGSLRWRAWAIDNDSESGSNVGSSLSVYRYSDVGGYLGRPIQIERANGRVWINDNDLLVPNGSFLSGGAVRVQGSSLPYGYSGDGAELAVTSANHVRLIAYDRTGSHDMELELRGSKITLSESGSNVVTVDGGDVYTNTPANISGSCSYTGWSSRSVTMVWRRTLGKMCWITFYVSGTSNSATTIITLPNSSENTTNLYWQFAFHSTNGTTEDVGIGSMAPNTYNVYLYRNGALDPWSTTGTKTVIGQFFYQLA